MSAWYETYRGVVFPWHCDQFGHMNVRWYAHHFDDAGFHLWSMANVPQVDLRARGVAMVVAQIKIDFVHELREGDLLVIKSGFTHVGNKSLRHLARMYNADSQVICATQESVEVFFDPDTRKSAPMPDDVRQALEPQLVSPESA